MSDTRFLDPAVAEPGAGSRGLVGVRYLLAVLLLAVLTSIPMLAAVSAGLAALDSLPSGPGTTAVRPFLVPGDPAPGPLDATPAPPDHARPAAEPDS